MSDDFQARAGREGRKAQEIAVSVLEGAGFTVLKRNQVEAASGATVNIVAGDVSGDEWFFDVSGSFSSQRAGLIRTDTMWKSLGRANALHSAGYERLILLTTNLPDRGSVGHRAMATAASSYFDAIEMLSPEGKLRLRQYAQRDRRLPLPGFRSPELLYPGLRRSRINSLDRVEVPVGQLGDPVPARRSNYDVQAMPYRVKVFIPSKDSQGVTIPARRRNTVGSKILEQLADHAGGCTSQEAIGSWIDPVGGVMHENVSVVEAWASEGFPDELMERVVALVIGDLNQHTAAFVINDRMVLLTPAEV